MIGKPMGFNVFRSVPIVRKIPVTPSDPRTAPAAPGVQPIVSMRADRFARVPKFWCCPWCSLVLPMVLIIVMPVVCPATARAKTGGFNGDGSFRIFRASIPNCA